MITKETCAEIWHCHNEIEKGENLLQEMGEILKRDPEKNPPQIKDVFGGRRDLQLGVPCGSSAHTLYSVGVELGVQVIEAHIERKKRRLEELRTIARLELNAKS